MSSHYHERHERAPTYYLHTGLDVSEYCKVIRFLIGPPDSGVPMTYSLDSQNILCPTFPLHPIQGSLLLPFLLEYRTGHDHIAAWKPRFRSKTREGNNGMLLPEDHWRQCHQKRRRTSVLLLLL